MTQPVLIVEDDQMQRNMLSTLLRRKLDFKSREAEHGRQALEILEADQGKTIKLVILDLNMPVMGGMETLGILRQKYPSIPVIMLTGTKDITDAVQAMKLGAIDFLMKPYEGERIVVTIRNALKISTLSKEVSRLKSEKEGTFTFENLIGHDDGLSSIVNIGRKAAASDIPILITGETGTGKEVFAEAIHGEGERTGKPFIAVNCGAIPSQLVESTLFGHEKGAFTGAYAQKIGLAEVANGGTLFLDEIGELSAGIQSKLLRFLQEGEIYRVGGKEPIKVDIRLVSATNRDLEKEVQDGSFREDLYYRINTIVVNAPPLRKRKEDIGALVDYFLTTGAHRYLNRGLKISTEALDVLLKYDWPGNIRELQNVCERLQILSESEVVQITDLPDFVKTPEEKLFIDDYDPAVTLHELERRYILKALNHFEGNKTQAANALGVTIKTLYNKLHEYGEFNKFAIHSRTN